MSFSSASRKETESLFRCVIRARALNEMEALDPRTLTQTRAANGPFAVYTERAERPVSKLEYKSEMLTTPGPSTKSSWIKLVKTTPSLEGYDAHDRRATGAAAAITRTYRSYDAVYSEGTKNSHLYAAELAPVIENLFSKKTCEGSSVHVTILAYGMVRMAWAVD